jgi:membrane-bound metal-dependent hydrolase YbcI (DUF457 family)
MPLLLAASVLPDMDLLLSFIQHRGPTHSIITITFLMIPFFVVYRKKAIPYFAALLSHILIGDFFTGGIALFWPLSNNMFGALNFEVNSLPIALTELILFLFALPLMYKLGDLKDLLKPNDKSWALIISLGSIIGPLIVLTRVVSLNQIQENTLPSLLVIPSLIYICIFTYSLYAWLKWRPKNNKTTLKSDKK